MRFKGCAGKKAAASSSTFQRRRGVDLAWAARTQRSGYMTCAKASDEPHMTEEDSQGGAGRHMTEEDSQGGAGRLQQGAHTAELDEKAQGWRLLLTLLLPRPALIPSHACSRQPHPSIVVVRRHGKEAQRRAIIIRGTHTLVASRRHTGAICRLRKRWLRRTLGRQPAQAAGDCSAALGRCCCCRCCLLLIWLLE